MHSRYFRRDEFLCDFHSRWVKWTEKRSTMGRVVSDGVNQQMQRIFVIDFALMCFFLHVRWLSSHPYNRPSVSLLLWCCGKLVFGSIINLMNIDCFRVNICAMISSQKSFLPIISRKLVKYRQHAMREFVWFVIFQFSSWSALFVTEGSFLQPSCANTIPTPLPKHIFKLPHKDWQTFKVFQLAFAMSEWKIN